MKRIANISVLLFGVFILLVAASCNNSNDKKVNGASDSLKIKKDTTASAPKTDTGTVKSGQDSATNKTAVTADKPLVKVYNFHITNRCASCIAIEEATTKTLNTYFASEVKQGRIKRYILNVDDDANKAVSEKYQAFGSGLFVTRIFKGKETTADHTGDGFKYAKNKEEKFIEILKNQISEYLK